MQIYGLQKTTLIDYPDHIACTVFTGGCSFRCPFCHNPELVQPDQIAAQKPMSEKDFFHWLSYRKGELEGVCITGGEPTVQTDLPEFCRLVKDAGFKVKLDSNGTNPVMLKELIEGDLVDFIAMDIKNVPEKYAETVGVLTVRVDDIQKSVELIRNSGLPYDFRTTVVRGLHDKKDIEGIAKWLAGSEFYSLQNFQDTPKANNSDFQKGRSFSEAELEEFRKILAREINKVRVLN